MATSPKPKYWRTFLTAAVSELPKLATVLLTVFLTAGLAWWVTAGLTARWDIRKKRQEFDLRKVPDRVQIDTTLNFQNRVQNHPFIGRHRLLNRTAVI
jgi:hypothetical protein